MKLKEIKKNKKLSMTVFLLKCAYVCHVKKVNSYNMSCTHTNTHIQCTHMYTVHLSHTQ